MVKRSSCLTYVSLIQMRFAELHNPHFVCVQFGPRYSWSAYEESLVVGAYFYGNVLSSFPSGLLIERFGYAKLSLGLSLLLIIGLTWLSPLAAGVSFSAMFTVRLLIGLLTGGRVPAFTLLISKWAPSNELGLFTFTNMGTNIGTVLSWSLAGLIIETLGWAVAFYVSGCIALVFVCCWMWLVYDSPAVHPRITADERAHIEANIHGVSECRGWPPLGRMLGSLPFWALMIAQFSNAWGTFFVLTAVPKFFNEVRIVHLRGHLNDYIWILLHRFSAYRLAAPVFWPVFRT